MKNREKYAQEIIDMVLDGDFIAIVNGTPRICENIDCNDCDFAGLADCWTKVREWAESEYGGPKIQPAVKLCNVDDKVLVSKDGKEWANRYFAKYECGIVFAWDCGATSWSTDGGVFPWSYAKLPEASGSEEK